MKIVAKKIIIYSMLGLMQIGVFSSVAAAAPVSLHNSDPQQIVQLNRHDRHDNDRQHDERIRREREQHEREMRRRHNERQRHKDKHDDHKVRDIAAILLGIAILSGASDN